MSQDQIYTTIYLAQPKKYHQDQDLYYNTNQNPLIPCRLENFLENELKIVLNQY